MKNSYYIYLTLLTCFHVSYVVAQENKYKPDSTKIISSSQLKNTAQFRFADATFINPAIYFHNFNFSNSEFSVGHNKTAQDQAIVEQIGTGNKGYGFTATTLLAPGQRYRTWGKAQYLNKTIQGQYKNLTSDYERIYPYYTGDTLAARDISSETYYLGGGYAQDQGKYTWGISASSRNLQDYRQVDPRPRNRVSDINISGGLAWKLPKKYTIGLAVDYNTYKQSQTISFLSEERRKIVSSLYHFTGLGNSSYDSETSAFSYEGQRYGTTLSLYPITGNGIFANVRYLYDNLDKNLTGSSSVHSIMNMGEDQYDLQLGWLGNTNKYAWAVKTNYNRRHRIGAEVTIASLAEQFNLSGVYSYAMFPYYQEDIDKLQLQLYLEKIGPLRWFVMPDINYTKSGTLHTTPKRSLDWERLKYGLSTGLSVIKGKHLISFNIDGAINQHLSSNLDIANRFDIIYPNGVVKYERFLLHSTATQNANYKFISTSNKQLAVAAKWEWQLLNNKSLFINPSYQKGWYTDNIGTQFYELKVGMVL